MKICSSCTLGLVCITERVLPNDGKSVLRSKCERCKRAGIFIFKNKYASRGAMSSSLSRRIPIATFLTTKKINCTPLDSGIYVLCSDCANAIKLM